MAYMNTSQANISHLSAATGLAPSVAQAWLANEGQSTPNPTNPLNIRTGNTPNQTGHIGGFGTYASPAAGLDAAGWLLRVSSHYTGIISAIKSGTPLQQAQAIQNSPWAAGHYSYSKISSMISGNSSIPSGGASTPLTVSPSTTNPGSGLPQLPELLGMPADTKVTPGNLMSLRLKVESLLNGGKITATQANNINETLVGLSLTPGSALAPNAGQLGGTSIDPTTGASPGIAVPSMQDAVTFVGIILVGVAFLGLGGLIALRKKSD